MRLHHRPARARRSPGAIPRTSTSCSGDAVTGTEHRVELLRCERFADARAMAEFYAASFGPAVALQARLPPEGAEAVRASIGAWAAAVMTDGSFEMEYLLTLTARANTQ